MAYFKHALNPQKMYIFLSSATMTNYLLIPSIMDPGVIHDSYEK